MEAASITNTKLVVIASIQFRQLDKCYLVELFVAVSGLLKMYYAISAWQGKFISIGR